MSEGIYTALSGALARQRQLDQVSHNLANVDTAGYRQTKQSFNEVMVDATRGLHHVTQGAPAVDFTPGRVQETGNPLDLAIAGPGFFQLEGGVLTRDGNFRMDTEGYLVSQRGARVLDDTGAPIQLTATPEEVMIGEGGDVWDAFGMVAHIGVVEAQDPRALQAVDGGFTTNAQNLMPGAGGLIQGSLERSNVDPVTAMTDMISLQRHFEAMNNLIQTHKRTDQTAIEQLGRVS